jgi:hypothetical protein
MVMRLTVNLTQENYELLRQFAQSNEMSLSDALNELVEEFHNRPATMTRGPDGFPLLIGLGGLTPDAREAEALEDRDRLRDEGIDK